MSPIELKVAEASRKTITALNQQGMSVNQNYNYDAPSLPADITDLIEEQVMDLYTKYVAYLEFINLQLWCAEVDKAEADKNLSYVRANKRLALKKTGTAVAMIDAEIEVDPDYKDKADALQELSNYHGLIHIISERLSKDISLINREITRRVNINKATGRSSWMTP
jgi:inhibitor of KinA sporulation pathway (predicted exonuclease)